MSSNRNAFAMNQTDENEVFVHANVQIMSNIFYPTIMSIGVVGNVLVIIVILKNAEMRNSTNIFLANLAIADLMLLLVYGPAQLINVNSKQGVLGYGAEICTTVAFIRCLATNTSALIILAISFERYSAICKPLRASHICTKSRAYKVCLFAWAFVLVCNTIYTPFTHYTRRKNDGSHNMPFCWKVTNSPWKKALHGSNVFLFYFLPLVTLTVVFLKIAQHLKRAAAGCLKANANIAAIRHRNRVVVMLATVVVCFFVCLLPSRILFTVAYITPEAMRLENHYYLYNLCCYLLYIHSALNPILYNLMAKRFREGFKNIYEEMTCGTSGCVKKLDIVQKDSKDNKRVDINI